MVQHPLFDSRMGEDGRRSRMFEGVTSLDTFSWGVPLDGPKPDGPRSWAREDHDFIARAELPLKHHVRREAAKKTHTKKRDQSTK